jgi:putative SOS response-associated peptidase YedK
MGVCSARRRSDPLGCDDRNPLLGGVQDCMPVMLMPEDYDAWFGPTSSPEELRALLRSHDASLMEAYAVSRAVNSVKNDTEECIEPIVDA